MTSRQERIAAYERWANRRPGRIRKAADYLFGSYYTLTAWFSVPPSLGGLLLGAVAFGASFGILIVPPLWPFFMGRGPAGPGAALHLSAVMLLLLVVQRTTRVARRSRGHTDYRRGVASQLARSISLIGAAVPETVDEVTQRNLNDAATCVLKAIHERAQQTLGDVRRHMNTSLLLYCDQACDHMRLCQQVFETDKIGTPIPTESLMAHYVARYNNHRVIHDFRRGHPFPKVGPGFPKPRGEFRSLLILPILLSAQLDDVPPAGNSLYAVGVVVLDSNRPYHFWGLSDRLSVELAPYLALLKAALKTQEYGIEVIPRARKEAMR